MKRANRRPHGSKSPMTHWIIDHQNLDIFVETNGHSGMVDLVIEVDPYNRQITSMEIVPRQSNAPSDQQGDNC